MTLGQIQSAGNNNNTKAFELLFNIAKEQEIINTPARYELPARLIGKAFVDLYRSILNREFQEYLINGGRGSTKSSFMGFMPAILLKK